MSFFKSSRERRLWALVLVVLVGIYATLFLSGIFTKLLYNQNFSAFIFLLVMTLIAVAVLTKEIKIPKNNKEIWVWVGVIAVYLMFFLRLTMPERSHLMEYSVLALLIHEALKERQKHGGQITLPALLAILMTAFLGALDECIQLFIPNRYFDPVDIIFNTLAGLMAVASSSLIKLVKNRFD